MFNKVCAHFLKFENLKCAENVKVDVFISLFTHGVFMCLCCLILVHGIIYTVIYGNMYIVPPVPFMYSTCFIQKNLNHTKKKKNLGKICLFNHLNDYSKQSITFCFIQLS